MMVLMALAGDAVEEKKTTVAGLDQDVELHLDNNDDMAEDRNEAAGFEEVDLRSAEDTGKVLDEDEGLGLAEDRDAVSCRRTKNQISEYEKKFRENRQKARFCKNKRKKDKRRCSRLLKRAKSLVRTLKNLRKRKASYCTTKQERCLKLKKDAQIMARKLENLRKRKARICTNPKYRKDCTDLTYCIDRDVSMWVRRLENCSKLKARFCTK